MSPSNAPGELRLPEGSSLDHAALREVASVSNRAHQALGTQLLAIDGRVVVLGIEPSDPASFRPPSGEWPNGVITSLLDHACAMAALIALDDPARFGGSLGLHVEYLEPSDAESALHVRAECRHHDDVLVRTHAVVLPPLERHLAVPDAGIVHGGVVAAFLEATATLHLRCGASGVAVLRTVEFTSDFLRPIPLATTFAEAVVLRRGRRFASVRVEAWQAERAQLVGAGLGRFALGGAALAGSVPTGSVPTDSVPTDSVPTGGVS